MAVAAAAAPDDLWSLVYGRRAVDRASLAAAVDAACASGSPDSRTRVLVRDAVAALRAAWGDEAVRRRLSPGALTVADAHDLGPVKFPSLGERLMDRTTPDTVLRFLRELGESVRDRTRVDIGGSTALILAGALARATEDVDVVDEVPPPLRAQHDLLAALTKRYGLRLAHFQSHYLPDGWQHRVRSVGRFGGLDAFAVDPLDIALGKLFSRRDKDLDDLRDLLDGRHVDRAALAERLRTSGNRLAADPALRANATRNWHVLFGEHVPPLP